MIITPDGLLYKYNRRLKGMKISPDEAYAIMEEIIQGLYVTCYIDNLGIWMNGAFDEHTEMVDKVLQKIATSNIKINSLKCDWGITHTDF